MDIEYFLLERTKFIRFFYDNTSQQLIEIKRKIEAEEEPYVPPYSEDPEPYFLEEWLQADEALEVLGRSCVSMLSNSLKLYFTTWESRFWNERPCEKCFKKEFKRGFLRGYRACFEEAFKINWSECPSDFEILEQITMARNADQHPGSITSLNISHSIYPGSGRKSLFFLRESENVLLEDSDTLGPWFKPSLHVSRELLFKAIEQVEGFVRWLEKGLLNERYPKKN